VEHQEALAGPGLPDEVEPLAAIRAGDADLVLIGADASGRKELLAVEDGFCESVRGK
jgi:nucleotide-binding universal stress UspA family protein